jgi:hypothetical protein
VAVALAFGLGALAWMVDQGIGYPLVKPVCANGDKEILQALAAGALLMTAAGGWIAATAVSGGDRQRFLAIVAVGFNVLIALLVLTAGVAPFVLDPCQ